MQPVIPNSPPLASASSGCTQAPPEIHQSESPPPAASALVSGRRISALLLLCSMLLSCGKPGDTGKPAGAASGPDPHLATNGTVEVTARLLEIPDGAIFNRDLYDYATILKYQVTQVHRGKVADKILFIGHYNPWKPRNEAADKRVSNIGGTLKHFRTGESHRMALDVPIDDHFMGGIVNKYFGQTTNALYWAVWTNAE
jgi:hypothetical protein